MKRRTLLTGAAATLAATPLARPHAQKPVTISWWYHFDDPKATPDELVAAFEKDNPGIKIEPENIPWGGGGDYDNRMYTSLIAGNGPDTAMVKFNNLARLMEMDALTPLDKWIDAWPGKADISADLWRLHTAPDGKRYYMPLQYVVLYLYVRLDLLAKVNLKPPDQLRRVPDRREGDDRRRTLGLRLARRLRAAMISWMPFAFGTGAKPVKGGFVSPAALSQNRYFIDLHRVHKVCPPSAPDRRVPADHQQHEGRPHGDDRASHQHRQRHGRDVRRRDHRGAGAARTERHRLGDLRRRLQRRVQRQQESRGGVAVDFVAVHWRRTTSLYNKAAGQMTVTTSGAAHWTLHPKRFVDATVQSLPIAGVLPNLPQTADFTRVVWPQNTQKALLGQIHAG